MKNIIATALVLLVVNLLCHAQDKSFNLSGWTAVKAKAKAEKKYIFVDCYATWCKPCKWMDENVLSDHEVADFLNSHFVSVKLQMDRTSNDSEETKKWYEFASDCSKQYDVKAYPSYLIFTANGNIVHRFSGSAKKDYFISSIKNSLDKKTQYYFIKENYEHYSEDSSFLLKAINICLDANDKTLAKKILDKYLNTVLNPISEESLVVLPKLTDTSSDRSFQILLTKSRNINTIVGKDGFAERQLARVLKREFIDPVFLGNDKIRDWTLTKNKIITKYPVLNEQTLKLLLTGFQNRIVEYELFPFYRSRRNINWDSIRIVLINRYPNSDIDESLSKEEFKNISSRGEWEKAAQLTLQYLDKYASSLTYMEINDYVWDHVFEHSADTSYLKRALKWSKYTVEKQDDPHFLDTYANLLYKLGEVDSAILFENKALTFAIKTQQKDVKSYQETLYKMTKGDKTWKSYSSSSFGQKKVIDSEAIKNWPYITREQISPDGKYISYYVNIGNSRKYKLIVKSTASSWSREFNIDGVPVFSDDSRFLVFLYSTDLLILDLTKNDLQTILNVQSFKLTESRKQNYIAYILNDTSRTLIVKNLVNGKMKEFSGAETFNFSPQSDKLVVETRIKSNNSKPGSVVNILLLPSFSSSLIYTENDVVGFNFDKTGNQLVFLLEKSDAGNKKNYIYYHKFGNDSLSFVINESSLGMNGLSVSREIPGFSKDGKTLYLYLNDTTGMSFKNKGQGNNVVVRNIAEKNESSLQPWHRKYLSAIQLSNDKLIVRRLINKEDFIKPIIPENDFFWFWRKAGEGINEFYLSSSLGQKTFLTTSENFQIFISPEGKYVFWYDGQKCSWFTCHTQKRTITEITSKITEPLSSLTDRAGLQGPEFMLGWLPNDEYVLINDRHDIWKVDPAGIKPSQNITKGYGKKNGLKLRALFPPNANVTISKLDSLILMGFNPATKEKGYFRLLTQKNGSSNVVPLNFGMMGTPFPAQQSDLSIGISGFHLPALPIQAKYQSTYLLKRSDNNHYPNLYTTNDFIHFNQLTNFEPQKQYNWYQSELFHWKLDKDKLATGMLFKPENFDSSKKYPLIFYYYEKSSDAFNCFVQPEFSNGDLNIPWMVSHGYIIAVTDIYYRPGFVGDDAAQNIITAADYLAQFPWVDKTHIGLEGGSHGGYETNFIITRSNKFAAAVSSAGISNLTSKYFKSTEYYEFGQGRMGKSLWENLQGYIDQSPIFKADRITTPLLLNHNEKDGNVSIIQSSDLFAAMKRLNKPCWFVNYINEGHSIDNEDNAYDFTIKMNEFFDHYLKNAPMPGWMK
jgi:thioredoxin-related protein/dienelactone hydrolase